MRARRPSSSAAAWPSVTASGTSCSRRFDGQEELQQIVEEALPQSAWGDALVVAHDQPTRLRFSQRLFRERELQAGALGEPGDGEPFGQAQGVHHEFEHEILASDFAAFLHRTALGHALEIVLGLLPAGATRDAIEMAHLAVRAGADA